MNGSHEIIQIHVISVGTLNRTLIHPREIFGAAIREDAAAIIVCHNHPSGNCEPSEEDIQVTHNLERVGEIMGIELLDHIIVCRDSYFSFVDSKMLLRNKKKNVIVKIA